VRRSLLEGTDAWHELSESLEEVVRWVLEGEGRGAIVLTSEASTAVYRACRKRGVRASAAADPDAVARAVRALGVNVVVIEPAGKSIALIKQMASTFRRASGPVVPDWLRLDDPPPEGATP
jgi:hypothetical protein